MGNFNEAFLCLAIEHWIWILRVWGFLMIRSSSPSSPFLLCLRVKQRFTGFQPRADCSELYGYMCKYFLGPTATRSQGRAIL